MIYNNNGTTLLKLPNVVQVRTSSLSKKKECEVNSRNGNSNNNNNFGFNYLQQMLPKIVVSGSCSKGNASFDKKVKVCCNYSNNNNKKGNNWFMNDMRNICFNKCSMMHKRNERRDNDNVKCDCSELSTNNTNETYENNNENIIVNIKETTDESEMSDNSIFTFSLLSSKQNELQDNLDTSNYKINYDEYSFSLSDNNESMC